MARSPIEIPIASETGAFEKGIKSGIIEPLKDAEKALEDLGESRGPEQLERDMRDAQKQTEKLKDETKRAADAIDTDFKRAYREAKQSADDGLSGIQRHTQEATGELKQNLGETFSSFRGDLEDLPQIAQDVFGGMAGQVDTLVGSLALAGGAAGIGLLISAWQTMQEEQKKSEERIADWAQAYIDAGGRVLSASQIIASAQDIITDDEKWNEAKTNAENWGVSVETAVLAAAGQEASIKEVGRALDEQTAAYQRLGKTEETNYEKQTEAFGRLKDGSDAYQRLTGEMEKGQAQADVMSQALINVARNTEGASQTVDEFGDTVISLPDGKQIYIDAETGQATQDVDAIEQKVYGVKDKTVRMRVTLDASEWDKWVPGAKVGRVRTAVEPGGGGGTTWF
ncbi:hypothetical protein [Microbacterium testaceum]|uniref:hypothetical protein n=1 Tax=Microbacterium testaceum TaxID=2033 RepID=UPI0022DEAC5F|nr:hypothetical protein [Microbacterium testaceum]